MLGIKTNTDVLRSASGKQVNESKIKDAKATVNLMDGINVIFLNYVVIFAGYSAKVFIFY